MQLNRFTMVIETIIMHIAQIFGIVNNKNIYV